MMPRIYIRDQNDEVLDTLDEGQYFDDNMQRFLKGKATVLSFTIVKDEASYALMTAGRNLSFRYDEEDFWLSCVIVEQDETHLTVTAWSLGLELNNETHGPYKAPKAMTFAEYLAVIDIERILTIGINEVSDKKISHEWEGTESKLARLYSLATVFGAELAFDTELNEDGSLKQISLNVYREHSDTDQGLGQDRRNETFYFGEDIKTIRKTEDTSDLYTAIFATGKDGLTIAGIEKEVFDEGGNLLFATYKTQKPGFGDPRKLYAPQARDQFPSNTTGGDRWTLNTAGEFEYESAEALLGYMMSELKKNCQPATTWEIEGYIKAKIGDTVRIADEGYKPTLYLEARVIEQEISFSDKTKNKSTFSNVVELESDIDPALLNQVQKLIEANKTYQYSISTDNGVVFKNNTGTTTLTATVRDGVADVTTNFAIAWFKDGVAVGSGISITVQATEVVEKAVYRFEASRDGNVVGGYEVTVSDVSDGVAGQTPVVHPAWGWNPDGTDRFTTEYPRENLLKNTFDYASGWSFNNQALAEILEQDETPTKIIKFNYNPNGWVGMYQTYVNWPVKPKTGYTVTLSFYAKGNGRIYSAVDGVTGAINVDATDEWQLYNLTGVANKDISNIAISLHNIVTTATSIYIHSVKFEINDKPTIYTPAPSEDPLNAYPLYEGTYSDYSETASTNPTDYTWRRIIGESGQDGNNGADGVGIANTKIDYQLHTSATTPPTGTWVTSPPAVTVGKYLWTRTILEYTDGTKATPAYSVSGGPGATGPQGPPTGVISQSTVPSSPYVGMLWQNTGNIAGYINPATYRWNGSAWEIYQFTAQNILAETFTGFVFQGVKFIGSEFISQYEVTSAGGIKTSGTLTIGDGLILNQYQTGSDTSSMFKVDRNGDISNSRNEAGVSSQYELTADHLSMSSNGVGGQLTARQLMQVPWTNLPYESGFTTAENNPCQYRIVYLLDGSRELQMRGQVQNTTGTALPTATSPYIGLLPATARPVRNELVAAADSSRKGARVTVLKNGYIQIDTPNANTTYVSLGGIRILLE